MDTFPSYTKNFEDKLILVKNFITSNGIDDKTVDEEYIKNIEEIIEIEDLIYTGIYYDRSINDNTVIFQKENSIDGDNTPISITFSLEFINDESKDFISCVHNYPLFGKKFKVSYRNCELEDLSVFKIMSVPHRVYNSSVTKRVAVSLKSDLENIDLFNMEEADLVHLRLVV